jgi:prepilin-type N-terminal cleavage/methylation domain-containing protein
MMNISTPRSRRSGFTLMEVAIALAIFVFGALAIVQIFPPALGVIRNNESRVAATQLGETMLARATGKPESVPDAIFEQDSTITASDNPYQWSDLPAALVGTPTKNNSLPAGVLPIDLDASALGRFKFIDGERHTVRNNGTDKWVLLNHPVEQGSTVWVEQEEEIQGVQIDEDGKLNFAYATDSNGQPFRSPTVTDPVQPPANKDSSDNVTYYVSYKWIENGVTHGVIDDPLVVPELSWTGTDGIVAVGVIHTDDRIIPGSVKVRYRQRLGSTVLNGQSASAGFYDVTDGQVVDASSNPVNLTAGKTYRFSYTAADWRWLVDDGGVASPSGTVQLPVKNLEEQPVWSVRTGIGNASTPLVAPASLTDADRKNGTVPSGTLSGFRYRTVYRALDGWAQQLSVAAKSYIPYLDSRPASSPREHWREYFHAAGDNKLIFHPSEAGKSVLISYVTTAGVTVNDVVLSIDNIETSSVPDPGFFGTYKDNGVTRTNDKVAYAVITDLAGNPVTAGAVGSILSVQGLSIQARTAWQNADRYNQVIVPAYRTLLQ